MEYKVIEGIKCYSPELAFDNNNFNKTGYELLYKTEATNFWFKSRNNVITNLFKKYLGVTEKKNILEIGCGTGFVLKALSQFENYNLTGAEIHIEGLKYAKRRVEKAEFIQCDATNLPFENEFDAIGAFDVLEHIENDELVMKNIFKALKRNGKFFISVPQHMFMWSVEDEISCHKRRYSRSELKNKIIKSGFEIEYIGSFVTALFPAMYLSRLFQKVSGKTNPENISSSSELELSPLLNKTFERIMKFDETLINSNVSLPFGGSLILVAKK